MRSSKRTAGYETGPLVPTRFGSVPTLPAVANRTPNEQQVLLAASQRGVEAAGWLMDLSQRQPDPEHARALMGMSEATAVALMAFNTTVFALTERQREELLRLLDLHASPDGSLVTTDRGTQFDTGDLLLVGALTAAVRTVVKLASMDWERDLPKVLELIDHILAAAAASLTDPPFAI